jgi:cyclophilin family peptidyl-prolyl cis-trans isomerase
MSAFNSLLNAFTRSFRSRSQHRQRSGRSVQRQRKAAASSLGGCEQLEAKQLLAVTLLREISVSPITDGSAITIDLANHFGESAVSGTVVRFETNAPLTGSGNHFFVELFDVPGVTNSLGQAAVVTPVTAANFKSYVNSDAYNNTLVHRSVKDFVVQGGGYIAPTLAADQPGSDPAAVAVREAIANEPGNANLRGTIAMAKRQEQWASATSQFYFNLGNNSSLNTENGGYAVFGKVLGSGMTVIDTMASALTYNATTYYNDYALGDLPLWNVNANNIIRPQDFVKFGDVSVVPETALMTFTVTSSDTSKLSASIVDGQLILAPVGGQTGAVNVTVTGTSLISNSSVSETFAAVVGSPFTAIESTGTVLNRSSGGDLYAGSTRILNATSPVNFTTYAGWGMTALAVESSYFSDGSAGLLWKLSDGKAFIWKLNGTTYARSTGNESHAPGTSSFFGVEAAFNIDVNGDGVVGLS